MRSSTASTSKVLVRLASPAQKETAPHGLSQTRFSAAPPAQDSGEAEDASASTKTQQLQESVFYYGWKSKRLANVSFDRIFLVLFEMGVMQQRRSLSCTTAIELTDW
jgi:hypothetical protein